MNQRDGFASGFLTGTLVGGVVGGFIGAILAARVNESPAETERRNGIADAGNLKGKRRQFKTSYSENGIEASRRSLEDKIAQLNETIDEVRLTLGQVNGQPEEASRTPLREELQ